MAKTRSAIQCHDQFNALGNTVEERTPASIAAEDASHHGFLKDRRSYVLGARSHLQYTAQVACKDRTAEQLSVLFALIQHVATPNLLPKWMSLTMLCPPFNLLSGMTSDGTAWHATIIGDASFSTIPELYISTLTHLLVLRRLLLSATSVLLLKRVTRTR